MSELAVKGVAKRFGALTALQDVTLTFRSGEIHAVLGENGAGKSTLMNVMSGFLAPDAGTVLLDGKPIPLGSACECKNLGIEMIHQHFTLVPEFSVAENLSLARLDSLYSPIDPLKNSAQAILSGKDFGWDLDAGAKTGTLPVGVQQRIEILKAISGDARVLIFDEPTAVLSPLEVEELFRVLVRLRDAGKIVVLIAHKLSEVLSVADRISVLRLGKLIQTEDRANVTARQLAEWMVGELPAANTLERPSEQGEGFEARDLVVLGDRGETAIDGVKFSVRRGEIFGIGGVDGNGQVELAEAVAQVRPVKRGELTWQAKPFEAEFPVIGYVPQDRQRDGLALGMSIQDNMLISALRRKSLFKGPFLAMRAVREWSQDLIARFSIKAGSPNDLAKSLSGGNQQKVVVSRTLDRDPNLLIVVNPTRGLDIKATQYVHDRILEARQRGAAVLLFSADLDELYALSDRTMFLSKGRLLEDTGAAALVGGEA